MPPSGEYSRRIGPTDAMVVVVVVTMKTQNTTLLASAYHFFLLARTLVVCENLVIRKGPSTHVMGATSFVLGKVDRAVAREVG
jgi:hypothetical protein